MVRGVCSAPRRTQPLPGCGTSLGASLPGTRPTCPLSRHMNSLLHMNGTPRPQSAASPLASKGRTSQLGTGATSLGGDMLTLTSSEKMYTHMPWRGQTAMTLEMGSKSCYLEPQTQPKQRQLLTLIHGTTLGNDTPMLLPVPSQCGKGNSRTINAGSDDSSTQSLPLEELLGLTGPSGKRQETALQLPSTISSCGMASLPITSLVSESVRPLGRAQVSMERVVHPDLEGVGGTQMSDPGFGGYKRPNLPNRPGQAPHITRGQTHSNHLQPGPTCPTCSVNKTEKIKFFA